MKWIFTWKFLEKSEIDLGELHIGGNTLHWFVGWKVLLAGTVFVVFRLRLIGSNLIRSLLLFSRVFQSLPKLNFQTIPNLLDVSYLSHYTDKVQYSGRSRYRKGNVQISSFRPNERTEHPLIRKNFLFLFSIPFEPITVPQVRSGLWPSKKSSKSRKLEFRIKSYLRVWSSN